MSCGGSRKAAWASAKDPCGERAWLGPMIMEGKLVICWAGGADGGAAADDDEDRAR